MLYYVPLEHLDERYTVSMDSLLQDAFRKNKIKYKVINGQVLSGKIESGAFLDFAGTNYFKSSQIQAIARLFFDNKIKDGDVFFFSDLWFPGIDALPYMSRFRKKKIKIVGYQYAGSWTPSDFVALFLKDYCKYIEHGWLEFFDSVFLCSNFQKNEMLANLLPTSKKDHYRIKRKLKVTHLPFDYDYVRSFFDEKEKERTVIFPHRFHWEKGAGTFLDMVNYVAARDKRVKFVITSGRSGRRPMADKKSINEKYGKMKSRWKNRLVYKSGLSKPRFYRELNKASVIWSGALQENFGYSVLEAATLGVSPVLPNRVVYPEFYPMQNIYSDDRKGFNMIMDFLDNPCPVSQEKIKKLGDLSKIMKYLNSLTNAK